MVSTMTVAELVSTLRDAGFFIGLCVVGWKARGLIQPLVDFFTRAQKHMDVMEAAATSLQTGMTTLLSNHLSHIESDLRTLSGRKDNFVHSLPDVDPFEEK
jgi:hypothetical protein